jgi:Transposase IS116/IS110/IS902 family
MLAQIDFVDEMIATLSERTEELTRPFSREIELLDTIPGVDRRAAEMLLAEIGPDMSRFPTDAHLASGRTTTVAAPQRLFSEQFSSPARRPAAGEDSPWRESVVARRSIAGCLPPRTPRSLWCL